QAHSVLAWVTVVTTVICNLMGEGLVGKPKTGTHIRDAHDFIYVAAPIVGGPDQVLESLVRRSMPGIHAPDEAPPEVRLLTYEMPAGNEHIFNMWWGDVRAGL